MGKRYIDYTGVRIGQCVVLCRMDKQPGEYAPMWAVECDCGNIDKKPASTLKSATTLRCRECYTRHAGDASRTHGETRTPGSLFQTWENMIKRCHKEYAPNYHRYGGRGITVHEPWRTDYVAFRDYILTTLGERSDGMTLDRKDNDGNYEPGNLRWATHSTQMGNRGSWAKDKRK